MTYKLWCCCDGRFKLWWRRIQKVLKETYGGKRGYQVVSVEESEVPLEVFDRRRRLAGFAGRGRCSFCGSRDPRYEVKLEIERRSE